MGIGKFLKKAARVVLPVAGAYFGGPIGAAAGSAIASKVNHDSWGQGLLNAGISAAGAGLGGAQGSLTPNDSLIGGINSSISGAFDPLRSGISGLLGSTTSLSNGVGSGVTGDFASGVSGSAASDPITSAARTAISGSATSGTGNGIAGFLPGAGGSVAGGGTASGFLGSGLGGDFASGVANSGGGFLSDPLGYAGNAITSGVEDVASPRNLISGIGKTGIAYLLQDNNKGGYGAVQGAANANAANYQPFLDTGTAAAKQLNDLYGLNGADAANAAVQDFQTTPGYQFARDQGIQALDASAARKGMLMSGNQDRAVQTYGTGLADQLYQQYLNNLKQQQAVGVAGAQGVGEGNMGASTAYMLSKVNAADNRNALLRGIASFL